MWYQVFVFLLSVIVFWPFELRSQDFYQGKTIRIVNYSKPGDSYDAWARLLSRHMSRYIPGNPAIIVENLPGAGGLIALNDVYTRAKPDGLTLLFPPRHFAIPQLVGEKNVRYDANKLTYIGSADSEAYILAIRPSHMVKRMEDLRKIATPVSCSATGKGATSNDFLALLNWAGFKIKIVSGYASKGEQLLAYQRGEVDCVPGSYSGSFVPPVEKGELKPLVQMAGRIFPDVPDILHVEMNNDAKSLFKIFSAPLRVGRPVVGPPGIPADRVEILRKAFEQTLRDSTLLSEAKKQQLEPAPLPAEEVAKTQREILSQPEKIARAYKEALEIQ
jgi:tripartite-type tricarboxylate transporter receptor subunit TctC